MNFSKFQQKVRQILAVELPSGKSIIKQVRSMAGDIKIGRTAFMDKMGVGSELAYKQLGFNPCPKLEGNFRNLLETNMKSKENPP